jgi:hypothetical protein
MGEGRRGRKTFRRSNDQFLKRAEVRPSVCPDFPRFRVDSINVQSGYTG